MVSEAARARDSIGAHSIPSPPSSDDLTHARYVPTRHRPARVHAPLRHRACTPLCPSLCGPHDAHAAPAALLQPAIAIPGGYLGALSLGVDNPALHTMSGLAASLMCFGGIAGLSSQVREGAV